MSVEPVWLPTRSSLVRSSQWRAKNFVGFTGPLSQFRQGEGCLSYHIILVPFHPVERHLFSCPQSVGRRRLHQDKTIVVEHKNQARDTAIGLTKPTVLAKNHFALSFFFRVKKHGLAQPSIFLQSCHSIRSIHIPPPCLIKRTDELFRSRLVNNRPVK